MPKSRSRRHRGGNILNSFMDGVTSLKSKVMPEDTAASPGAVDAPPGSVGTLLNNLDPRKYVTASASPGASPAPPATPVGGRSRRRKHRSQKRHSRKHSSRFRKRR
jgi:hypothetical protein